MALLVATALVYWPGLAGGPMLDDFANLKPLVAAEKGGLEWRQAIAGNHSGPLGRPVAMATFAFNWVASGGSVWDFKYTNLMLHLLTALLIFWLTGRLLDEQAVSVRMHRWWVALWVAAAWAFAPFFVSTVLYAIQRMAQLAALFVMAGLLCYVIGRQNLDRRFLRGVLLILTAFVVFWPLAALSKENGALLPVLALLVEIFFFGFATDPPARRFLIGVFVVTAAVPAVAAGAWLFSEAGSLAETYRWRDFTLWERLLSQPRALFDYVRQLTLPHGASMGVYHDDYPRSEGLLTPPTTLLAIIGWVSILIVAWWKRRSRYKWFLFGPVFFLAAHALESSVFPLELYFEHRNYLPAYGIFFSLALAGWYAWRNLPLRSLVAVVLVALPVGYAAACYQRVQIWRTPESILLASAETHPRSLRVHVELASLYADAGRLGQALASLERAEALVPEHRSSGIVLHRLLVHCLNGIPGPDRVYTRLERLSALDTGTYTVNILLLLAEKVEAGQCRHLDTARLAAAVHELLQREEETRMPEWRWKLHFAAARLLLHSDRRAEALMHLDVASQLYPEGLAAALLAFPIRLQMGDIEGARETLARLKVHDEGDVIAHSRRIAAYDRLLDKVDAARRVTENPGSTASESAP
ncbi:MAG: hypothetical protein GWN84_15815 [Gammaproteobacteria bacterium]|nr:hypothetical protein [Gammaproteobacteria bacterium]NIR84250.1 hypothetical protein [Gammaproteobacteria bacterium]NIR89720.1 hypothetical protein [Gammaproteobacteria bacterium]NIU05408.1 hypothetical protein [Gammaproteobacteria bacterium]NIV52354.1 hypothetical protein [Gammaproteobacteria bacterium]